MLELSWKTIYPKELGFKVICFVIEELIWSNTSSHQV